DHIGLGEVALGLELALQRVEKVEIEIDLIVSRTIERAHRDRGETASRLHAIAEEDQGRLAIGCPFLLKNGLPHIFGFRQNDADELAPFVTARGLLLLLLRRSRKLTAIE